MSKRIKYLDFVKKIGEGIEGFGVVLDHDDARKASYIGMTTMEDNFGVDELSDETLEILEKDEIKSLLKQVAKEEKKYPYFIIQLNDIPELNEYHIAESDYIRSIAGMNEVLID